jgi:aldehyde dehydrogenase (NAD+)
MDLNYDTLFIGGEWVVPSSSARISVVSANTEERIGSVPEAQESDVDAAVVAARRAFDDPTGWAAWSPADRASALERLADALERRADEIIERVSAQNGMPVALGPHLEGGFPVLLYRYYAEIARSAEVEEIRQGGLGGRVAVRKQPVGVVAAVTPWNLPQTLAAFKLAPALAAGCTVVLKPSPETVLDAVVFAEAVVEAGLPPGVVNIVPGGRDLGAYLVRHPQVDMVSFTGSTPAGREVGEVCGRLLRPATLELGGKSATIVLDDPDLDLASMAQELFVATLINNGQTCFLASRVLAPQSRYGEVVEFFTEFARSMNVGNSLDPATQIGPLVSPRQRDRVEGYIAKGLSEGGRITVGGARPAGLDRGWFVEPTVFADVDNNSTIAQEEIFGPVLTITPYSNDDDAVRIANASDYGLGGAVFTTDIERGLAIARRVLTGTIGVNTNLPDPVGPFGGVKASGIGRALGPEALGTFQHLKSIYLQPATPQEA